MKNRKKCVCKKDLSLVTHGVSFVFKKGGTYYFKSYGKSYYEMFGDTTWCGYVSMGTFSKYFIDDSIFEDINNRFNNIMDGV